MKNILPLLIVFSSLTLVAQKHLVGIQGGVSLTNVKTVNFPKQEFKSGLTGGLSYEYLLKSNFSLGADLLYVQRGFNSRLIFTNAIGQMTGENAISKMRYDYVSLPIKASFKLGEQFYGFGNIGLAPSILVETEFTIPGILGGESQVLRATDKVSKFDLAGLIEVGAGYKIQERFLLFASVAFQHSFTTITNANYFSNGDIYHYGFTFSLGVKYALGK
jgi:hypothetical protein